MTKGYHIPGTDAIDILTNEKSEGRLQNLFGAKEVREVIVPGSTGVFPQFPAKPVTPDTELYLLGRMINLLGINEPNTSIAYLQTAPISPTNAGASPTPTGFVNLMAGEQLLIKFIYPSFLFGTATGVDDAACKIKVFMKINTRNQNVNIDVVSPDFAERDSYGNTYIIHKITTPVTIPNYQIINVQSSLDPVTNNPIDTYVAITIDVTPRIRLSDDARLAFRIRLATVDSSTTVCQVFTRFTTETVNGEVLTPRVEFSSPKLARRAFTPEEFWKAFQDNVGIIRMRGRDDVTSRYVWRHGALWRVPVPDASVAEVAAWSIGQSLGVIVRESEPDFSFIGGPTVFKIGGSLNISLSNNNLAQAAILFFKLNDWIQDQAAADIIGQVFLIFPALNKQNMPVNVRVFIHPASYSENPPPSEFTWNNFIARQQLLLVGEQTLPANSYRRVTIDITNFFDPKNSSKAFFVIDTNTKGGSVTINTDPGGESATNSVLTFVSF